MAGTITPVNAAPRVAEVEASIARLATPQAQEAARQTVTGLTTMVEHLAARESLARVESQVRTSIETVRVAETAPAAQSFVDQANTLADQLMAGTITPVNAAPRVAEVEASIARLATPQAQEAAREIVAGLRNIVEHLAARESLARVESQVQAQAKAEAVQNLAISTSTLNSGLNQIMAAGAEVQPEAQTNFNKAIDNIEKAYKESIYNNPAVAEYSTLIEGSIKELRSMAAKGMQIADHKKAIDSVGDLEAAVAAIQANMGITPSLILEGAIDMADTRQAVNGIRQEAIPQIADAGQAAKVETRIDNLRKAVDQAVQAPTSENISAARTQSSELRTALDQAGVNADTVANNMTRLEGIINAAASRQMKTTGSQAVTAAPISVSVTQIVSAETALKNIGVVPVKAAQDAPEFAMREALGNSARVATGMNYEFNVNGKIATITATAENAAAGKSPIDLLREDMAKGSNSELARIGVTDPVIAARMISTMIEKTQGRYEVSHDGMSISNKAVFEFDGNGQILRTGTTHNIAAKSIHTHTQLIRDVRELGGDIAANIMTAQELGIPLTQVESTIRQQGQDGRIVEAKLTFDGKQFVLSGRIASGQVTYKFTDQELSDSFGIAQDMVTGAARISAEVLKNLGVEFRDGSITIMINAKEAAEAQAQAKGREAAAGEEVSAERQARAGPQDVATMSKAIEAKRTELEETGMYELAVALAAAGKELAPISEHMNDQDIYNMKQLIESIKADMGQDAVKAAVDNLINNMIAEARVAQNNNFDVTGSINRLEALREALAAGFVSPEEAKLPALKGAEAGTVPAIEGGINVEVVDALREGAARGIDAATGTSAVNAVTGSSALAPKQQVAAAERTPVMAEGVRQQVKQESANIIAIDTNIPSYDKISQIYQLRGYTVCTVNAKTDDAETIAQTMETVASVKGYASVQYFALLDMRNSSKAINLVKLFENIIIGIKGERTDIRSFLNEAAREGKIVITDKGIERVVKDMMKDEKNVTLQAVEPIQAGKTDEEILNEELTNLAY
jgi:hypothetical protein